jgi:hypothetical protein
MSIRIQNQNPWRIWDPPTFPRPQSSTPAHVILPLKILLCSQKFIGSLEDNSLLCDKINRISYEAILNTINNSIQSPLLCYITIKCVLTFLSFAACVTFIISLIFMNFIWAGVSGSIILLTFYLIRESGNMYYKAMHKLKHKITVLIQKLQREHLRDTNVNLFCGDFCAWIDFTTAEQEIVNEPPSKVFNIFLPGCIDSKGVTTIRLI